MTDDSLQMVIDDVFDEYAEIMNSFLFPFEHCKDCGCHFTQPHDMACIGASILASIPRRCANLKHRLAALSAQTEARDAARYRWLKKGRKTKDELLAFILIKDVDAAIDKAIAQGDL